LLAANTRNYVISEVSSCLKKALESGSKIADFNRKTVPTSRHLTSAVGHRLTTTGRRVWRTEDKAKIAEREHGENGHRMHLELEAKFLRIEGDRSVDIVDNVTDLNRGHPSFPSPDYFFLVAAAFRAERERETAERFAAAL
jgi:hypothetical protein